MALAAAKMTRRVCRTTSIYMRSYSKVLSGEICNSNHSNGRSMFPNRTNLQSQGMQVRRQNLLIPYIAFYRFLRSSCIKSSKEKSLQPSEYSFLNSKRAYSDYQLYRNPIWRVDIFTAPCVDCHSVIWQSTSSRVGILTKALFLSGTTVASYD